MLRFFREKAGVIGWAIVITFGGTMFAGSLFLGGMNLGKKKQGNASAIDNRFALIGTTPVYQQKYLESRLQNYQTFEARNKGVSLTPDQIEQLEYDAFSKALRFTILMESAKEQGVKISRSDLDNHFMVIYQQLDIKGKKELKKRLKEQNYPYDLFVENQKNELYVQAMTKMLIDQVSISDQDVDNQYKRIRSQHVLVKTGLNSDINEEEAKVKADKVYQEIQDGLVFKDAVEKYSDDIGTKENDGEIGWIRSGDVIPAYEDVVFSLGNDEVSKPVKSIYGFHIIKLLEVTDLPKPKEMDYEKEKENLMKFYQDRVVTTFVQGILNQSKLNIKDPLLKPIQAKVERNFDAAIGAYQAQVSLNPGSSAPHYFIAQMYLAKKNKNEAIRELEKADIKGDMNPSLDFASIHLLLANLYLEDGYEKKVFSKSTINAIKKDFDKAKADFEKNKDKGAYPPVLLQSIIKFSGKELKSTLMTKALGQYDKAFELSRKDKRSLYSLKQFFTELKDTGRLTKVNAAISVLEELEKAAIASANAQQKIDKAEIEKLLKGAKRVKPDALNDSSNKVTPQPVAPKID